MSKYRNQLPQLSGELFLTDGGIETTLIFKEGLDLPEFASFTVLESEAGVAALRKYFSSYAEIARTYGVGAVLDSATWRASMDWATKLGISAERLEALIGRAVVLLEEVRATYESDATPIVIAGGLGPRGDAYDPERFMSVEEAEDYHARQIETFRATNVDFVSALSLSYAEEAVGVARAAQALGMPVSISFTVETDGNLPSGESLESAIGKVEEATSNYPVYYMINCAHPTHFERVLDGDAPWCQRLGGLRANASCKSHAELDEAEELDEGHPAELAEEYSVLRKRVPSINVLGGCCGTDHRHIEAIVKAALAPV